MLLYTSRIPLVETMKRPLTRYCRVPAFTVIYIDPEIPGVVLYSEASGQQDRAALRPSRPIPGILPTGKRKSEEYVRVIFRGALEEENRDSYPESKMI